MGTVIRQANKTEAELKNGYIVLLSKKTVYPYKIALIISVSAFVDRFACQLHAKLLECLDIHVRKHHRSMCLTAMQFRKLFESKSGVFICRGACGRCRSLISTSTRKRRHTRQRWRKSRRICWRRRKKDFICLARREWGRLILRPARATAMPVRASALCSCTCRRWLHGSRGCLMTATALRTSCTK